MNALRRSARAASLMLVVAAVIAFATPISRAAEEPALLRPGVSDASDELFTNSLIPRLRIEIAGTNLAALQGDNRRYVRATVREGTNVYPEVGIHLKGAAGSFRALDDRPALTLNFDKFNDEQRFHGLDKLHLNNSVQDPSYMTEHLCGTLFREAGVPCPRVAYARVELNGKDRGLYVLKEGFDRSFLRHYFQKTKGNLYDGGFLREITEPLQRTSGEGPADHSDLKALAAAARAPDPAQRWKNLNQLLAMEPFISFVALEALTWHWDGYAFKRNNYRIYHDPASGRMTFLPHGMDQMFWDPNGPIASNFEGLVAQAVMQTPEGRQRYRERCHELFTNSFRIEVLQNRITELQMRLRPALAEINPELARQHDGAVANLRQQITQRIAGIARQLALPNPTLVRFDAAGNAALSDSPWLPQQDGGDATCDQVQLSETGPALHVMAGPGGRCVASWRTRVELAQGRYRFESRIRGTGIRPLPDGNHLGAGLRISGDTQSRTNHLVGDSPWETVSYEFEVPAPGREVVLVCELRAMRGEVWFDRQSLRLKRR